MAGQRGRVRHRRKSGSDELVEMFAGGPAWIPFGIAAVVVIAGAAMHQSLLGSGGALFVLVLGLAALAERKRRQRLVALAGSLESLRRIPWKQFEQLVAEAYRRRGFAVELTGGNGMDGGVDLILRQRGRTTLVQCKQWRRQVGVSVVRELAGVMHVERASAGVLVATEGCTDEALAFARQASIEVITGLGVLALLDLSPGTVVGPPLTDAATTVVCHRCGAPMVRRTSKYGQFMGCSTYPRCRGTRAELG